MSSGPQDRCWETIQTDRQQSESETKKVKQKNKNPGILKWEKRSLPWILSSASAFAKLYPTLLPPSPKRLGLFPPPPIVAYVTMLARPTQQEIRRKNEKIRPRRCCVVTSSSSKVR
jgi:hypothetical protein